MKRICEVKDVFELHDYGDGSPILINTDDVVMAKENTIIMRNNDVTVQEGYEEIKRILLMVLVGE